MCDVMPTISEDSISQRSSQFSGEDANFEQLMVTMLDERDKLMDSLRETQERLSETEAKLSEVEKERDSLQRQISATQPQVSLIYYENLTITIHRHTRASQTNRSQRHKGHTKTPHSVYCRPVCSFIDSYPFKALKNFCTS